MITNQSPAGDVEARAKYLRKVSDSERYTDFSSDPAALPIIQGLERDGFCRVVWDGPAWRVYQSSEQTAKAVAYLAKLTSTKPEPSRIAGVRVLAHRQLRSARDDGWDLSPLAEYIEALESNITAIEADRERLAKLWSDKRDDCDTATQEVERLQSDKDRLTKALEEIVGMTYAGAPDIYMKRIARAALSPPSTSQSEGER